MAAAPVKAAAAAGARAGVCAIDLYKLACFAPVSPAVSINTTRCRFFFGLRSF